MSESSVPWQMVSCIGVTVSVGATDELTVIVIVFEVAVVGEAHASEDVSTQVTASPLARVEVVNVLPVPTFVPFTFH